MEGAETVTYHELNQVLKGCLANPESVSHRLVYSDCLEEFGLEDHARLVRHIARMKWSSGGTWIQNNYYRLWEAMVWQIGDGRQTWTWRITLAKEIEGHIHTLMGRSQNLASAQRRTFKELMTHHWKRGCICEYLDKLI